MSEFGRTSQTNANAGTDHAVASCILVGGGTVNGGTYNCDSTAWPAGTMFAQDGRYVPVLTDYRSIFWEIMRDHMGAGTGTADAVFPGYTGEGLGAGELGLFGP